MLCAGDTKFKDLAIGLIRIRILSINL